MIRKLVEPNKYHPKKNSKIMSPLMPTTTFHPTPLVTFTTRNCSRRKSLQRNTKSEYYTPSCQLPISPTSRDRAVKTGRAVRAGLFSPINFRAWAL